jgi:hypothetical protein
LSGIIITSYHYHHHPYYHPYHHPYHHPYYHPYHHHHQLFAIRAIDGALYWSEPFTVTKSYALALSSPSVGQSGNTIYWTGIIIIIIITIIIVIIIVIIII